MRASHLVNADDLAHWAARLDAEGTLPQLVRRLIFETASGLRRIEFRAGKGVHLAGWDGVLDVDLGTAHVPEGKSGWETSTCGDVTKKASREYRSRCKNPRGLDPRECAFVFVTARRWPAKSRWEGKHRNDGIWRDIRVYDADDLETWLEQAPATHIWVSHLLGKPAVEACDLQTYWTNWSQATTPSLTREFLLAGRADLAAKIRASLVGTDRFLALQAESRSEAIAVLAAALDSSSDPMLIQIASRTVVVRSPQAWGALAAAKGPLVLVANFEPRDDVASAFPNDHRVVLPLGSGESVSPTTLTIPSLDSEVSAKVLGTLGLDETAAFDLARLARRSLLSFRRSLAAAPLFQRPAWAQSKEGRILIPALMAGAWSDARVGDRDALAKLAGVPYERLNEALHSWSNSADPPLLQIAGVWYLVSIEDAWNLLASCLTPADLERLDDVVMDVLGAVDPRFDLPRDKWWMAEALGHSRAHSDRLRDGLANTLAFMGSRKEATRLPGNPPTSEVVRKLLESANRDWRVWASIQSQLPRLAEAAPDVFLDAVDEALAADPPVLLRLFCDQDSSLFISSPHVGLLSALEIVAWSADYLSRAALLFARLAALDPGGTMGNRPRNSLREIFLPWNPQTVASLDQRLRVLDLLRRREPAVAWELLRHLLPVMHGSAPSTERPHWRDWASAFSPEAWRSEYARAVGEVFNRMMEDVDSKGERWRDLIKSFDDLPEAQADTLVERLAAMDTGQLVSIDRYAIWDSLRDLIAKHRAFPEARWALPGERILPLEALLGQFAPIDQIARNAWLFGDGVRLPQECGGDWRKREEAVEKARLGAVSTIFSERGLEGLLDLVRVAKQPGLAGISVGQGDLLESEEDKLLETHLASDDATMALFARGLVIGRFSKTGRDWLEEKLRSSGKTWTATQRAEALACLPADERTWALAESFDAETEREYWRRGTFFGVSDSAIERVARKLVDYGRPGVAVELLAMRGQSEETSSSSLIVDALEALLNAPKEDTPGIGHLSHQASHLLDVITRGRVNEEERIARLEWAYLPLVALFGHQPIILQRAMAQNPEFFAEVISWVFRAGEGEEAREVSEEERARAERGYDLLSSWRTVPGTGTDGTIDANMLQDWVRRARKACAESGRVRIGDQTIGQVLSGSPHGEDGVWPHPSVRDVIEEVSTPDLEVGVEIGLRNSRGFSSRGVFDGGVHEWQLADRHSGFAARLSDTWPRTAAMLRRWADRYRAEARRRDEEARLRSDLGL